MTYLSHNGDLHSHIHIDILEGNSAHFATHNDLHLSIPNLNKDHLSKIYHCFGISNLNVYLIFLTKSNSWQPMKVTMPLPIWQLSP